MPLSRSSDSWRLSRARGLRTLSTGLERRRVPSEKRNNAARPSLAPSDDGGSQLAIYRYGGYWRDASRAYQVFVDGQRKGGPLLLADDSRRLGVTLWKPGSLSQNRSYGPRRDEVLGEILAAPASPRCG